MEFGCVFEEKCHQNYQGLYLVGQPTQGAEKGNRDCQGIAVCLRVLWHLEITKQAQSPKLPKFNKTKQSRIKADKVNQI